MKESIEAELSLWDYDATISGAPAWLFAFLHAKVGTLQLLRSTFFDSIHPPLFSTSLPSLTFSSLF